MSGPEIVQPAVPPTPAERRRAFLDRVAADLAWVLKAKDQMRKKGVLRARKACPRCDGLVRLELLGPKAHVHALCETPSCLRVIE